MAMRWYVIHAYSGFEQKVADFIKEQAEKKRTFFFGGTSYCAN